MVASEREQRAEREAADWFGRLRSRSVSSDELTEFAAWRRDPANRRAYEKVEELWSASGGLSSDRGIRSALGEALRRRQIGRWLGRIATDRIALTMAASLAAVAIVVMVVPIPGLPGAGRNYHTEIGERSVIQLVDGTSVQLDTNSRVTARVATASREVELDAGQAYFDVRHDPAHPFVVDIGNGTTVTALGTRFDIRRAADGATVSLFEGSVAVANRGRGSSVRLSPGQSVAIENGVIGRIGTSVPPAWRDGRLAFHDTPLATAVDEMNRYTTRPLKVANPKVAASGVSGDFSTGDVDGFAAAANAIFGNGSVSRDADPG